VGREAKGVRRKIKKNIFCVALATLVFALCISAEAQQPKKIPRIGVLFSGTRSANLTDINALTGRQKISTKRQAVCDLTRQE